MISPFSDARRAACCALLALALLVPAAPAAAQMQGGNHAAVAFSRTVYGVQSETAARGIGTSWGWLSAADARRAAVRECSNNDTMVTDCNVVVSITRGCAAAAVGMRGVTAHAYAGRGSSVRQASAAAMQECRRNAQSCQVAATTCARFRDRP